MPRWWMRVRWNLISYNWRQQRRKQLYKGSQVKNRPSTLPLTNVPPPRHLFPGDHCGGVKNTQSLFWNMSGNQFFMKRWILLDVTVGILSTVLSSSVITMKIIWWEEGWRMFWEFCLTLKPDPYSHGTLDTLLNLYSSSSVKWGYGIIVGIS